MIAGQQRTDQTTTRLPLFLVVLLGMQVVSTFLSDSRFIPEIRNNVGAFEAMSLLITAATFVYLLFHPEWKLRFHPLFVVLVIWIFAAALSLYYAGVPRLDLAFTQVLILFFQLAFFVVMFNLLLIDQKTLLYILRCFAFAAFVVALWVIVEQRADWGNYNVSGPFRGRSHMGIYMMGAFWIVLFYHFYPETSRLERWATIPIFGLILYCIAVSLRQSVYAAMIVGILGLGLGFFVATGWDRLRIIAPIILVVILSTAMLLGVFGSSAQFSLFNREFTGLGDRLEKAAGTDENAETAPGFDVLQRRGALLAFSENPLLGIGWGGFYRSPYSPTGHELHSSTLRFVAELGIVGILIYIAFLGITLLGAARLFLRARNTPYQLSAFVLMVALIAYAVNHYYNRMFTDRPYWWALVIFMVFEAYMMQQVQSAPPVQTPVPRVPASTLPSQRHEPETA